MCENVHRNYSYFDGNVTEGSSFSDSPYLISGPVKGDEELIEKIKSNLGKQDDVVVLKGPAISAETFYSCQVCGFIYLFCFYLLFILFVSFVLFICFICFVCFVYLFYSFCYLVFFVFVLCLFYLVCLFIILFCSHFIHLGFIQLLY